MGLELVEFILDLENALGISIPDRDATHPVGADGASRRR
jgi:acyl carrier protein